MKPALPLPDATTLRSVFSYEPETGVLRFKDRDDLDPSHRGRWSGRVAGNRMQQGYIYVRALGRKMLAHRLIWKMVHDEEPPVVDHRNGSRADNRLANLRACTQSTNSKNTAGWKRRSPPHGVHYRPESGRYRAVVGSGRKLIQLGTFDTPEEARAAYLAGAEHCHGEFVRKA